MCLFFINYPNYFIDLTLKRFKIKSNQIYVLSKLFLFIIIIQYKSFILSALSVIINCNCVLITHHETKLTINH